jgi:hypothetical protein
MKNQIIDLLQWSSEDYENRVFQAYWNWCKLNAKFPLSEANMPSIEQQLLANASINKWFMGYYMKCEQKFLELVKIIGNSNIEQLEVHYKACTADVNRWFPKALMEGLKNNTRFQSNYFDTVPNVILN